ncbi:MAG: putative porin [Hydrogenophilaceae bacterium]|nr:putative porin [Hydrogenophilaceae bacterium]
MQKKQLCIALAMAGLIAVQPAYAGEREQFEALKETTLAIVDALVAKGILTREAAEAMVAQAEAKGREKAEALAKQEAVAPGVVRVPYIPEVVKREIREQIRQEVVAQAKTERWGDVNAVPEWVGRFKWEGDLRLRAQNDLFADDNIPQDFNLDGTFDNVDEARQRARLRARLGLSAKVTDSISAGFRITTGNTSDPVSTNQSLGNTGNKYSLVLDRAFAKVDPWDWLSASGGRIPNPFFSTDMVWDDDLNFEGVAATFKPWSRATMTAKPFFTIGAFPLQEVETSTVNPAKDKWLYGAQAGLDWRSGAFTRWRFGLAYYDYRNVKGVHDDVAGGGNPYAATAPQFRQKGNTLFDLSPDDSLSGLAADYRLLNFTAMADLAHFDPVHVIFTGDVVKNIGYDKNEVATLFGDPNYEARTLGWNAKLTVGKPNIELPGDWQVHLGYRYLERDAVLDAFTDSDFRLGGTDAQGYYLGTSYGVDRNAWISAKWMSANEIDGLPYGVDVLQVDFNAKF